MLGISEANFMGDGVQHIICASTSNIIAKRTGIST
jgi:hypothetical protein